MRARSNQLHRLRSALAAGAVLAALGLAAPVHAGAASPPGSVQLSNERTFTTWAHAAAETAIRERPKPNSWVVGTISLNTQEGLPEVFLLLRSWTDEAGREWLQVRAPMSRTVRTGWVDASAFGEPQEVKTQLVIDRGRLRATLYRAGRRVWRSRVGVGKVGTPTPAGRFWIRTRLRGKSAGGPYGPWAFGTSAFSRLSDWPGGGVIGIHGTNQPNLIPGRPSHGCIRVPNPAVRRLARLMPIGTPVQIR